jgi:DNA-binding response OmpR family regulator
MNKHIVIVEDDDVLANVLRDNLTFEGFRVDCAADGSAAIELVAAVGPDLVLLDVMLPGLDGFEVCRTLNAGQAVFV